MEDSGYMARIAFISDGLLRKLGLSGRSIVPMLISFGCTVPGVMATRTLPSAYDRKRTIILTPFMSCTAKLPISAFFVDAFFPRHKALIMIGLYFLGIIVGILVALLFKGMKQGVIAALANEPSSRTFIEAMITLRKNLGYRYQIEDSKDYVDVFISYSELKNVLSGFGKK